jgi:putative protease
MARSFRGETLELLAPAGSFSILEELLDSGADAFYVGGKRLNMRLHRSDLNFDDGELARAARLCHEEDKRLYVAVNKLLGADDIEELRPYLEFLDAEVHPDAILVQDLAVPTVLKAIGSTLPMHASVMMNAHNEAGARALKELGFCRLVLSREESLETARRIRDSIGIEVEYFVHGDMCVSHGSQCLYSGVLFGLSGNRGLCMKPCRWPFSARLDGREYESGFPLAVRDMCMHDYIPELVASGVSSFKIEGRMRGAAYLRPIISGYADAIDRFIADPDHFDRARGSAELHDARMRDFTTAYAFGRPGPAILNERWEGTGKFYSTGKVFSVAKGETAVTPEREEVLREALRRITRKRPGDAGKPVGAEKPELAVRVDSLERARISLNAGADVAILSGEPVPPGRALSPEELRLLRAEYPNKRLALQLPRMMSEKDYAEWTTAIRERASSFDELYVGHLGADTVFAPLAPRLLGDAPLNILNATAAKAWIERGLSLVCASLELGLSDLTALLASGAPLEILVHGRPTSMYMENDAYENATLGRSVPATSKDPFPEDILRLVDAGGNSHPVLRDLSGRSHLLTTRAIRLIGILPELSRAGMRRARIESSLYSDEELRAIVVAYRAVLDGAPAPAVPEDRVGWGFGALSFD